MSYFTQKWKDNFKNSWRSHKRNISLWKSFISQNWIGNDLDSFPWVSDYCFTSIVVCPSIRGIIMLDTIIVNKRFLYIHHRCCLHICDDQGYKSKHLVYLFFFENKLLPHLWWRIKSVSTLELGVQNWSKQVRSGEWSPWY